MAGVVMRESGRRYSLDQLAAEVDLLPSTIRMWIARGYVPRALGSGSRRYFTTAHRDRILDIKAMKEQQRTLGEIAEYLDSPRG